MTEVIYYLSPNNENPVKKFIESLSKQQKSKVFRIFTLIETYNLSSIIPHIKKLTNTPFWEIRILGQDNIRIFYVSIKNDKVLVLHGFLKKSQKTPASEILQATKRYHEWLDR